MSNGGSAGRPTKNERREATREKAKELRDAQRKKDVRNRIFLQGGILVVVIAIIAGIGFIIASAIKPPMAGPANMASGGIVIGQDLKAIPSASLAAGADPIATAVDPAVPNIRIYLDYLCPYCGEFEQTNAEQLADWADTGTATVEIHPVAILTGRSAGTQYSLRAANAAACVANYAPDSFLAFNALMFKDQPDEGTEGRTDAEIKEIVGTALSSAEGAKPTSKIESCIDDMTYKSWVQNSTDLAKSEPIPNSKLDRLKGTPTILVNDRQYTGSISDPKEFQAFVLSVASETYANSSPSPSPSPEAPAE